MRPLLTFVVFAALAAATPCFGRNIAWRAGDVPPVSLQEALELAKPALTDHSFYCISATLAKTFTDGDWQLRFADKDGKELWISIGSDKSIRKSDHGFEY